MAAGPLGGVTIAVDSTSEAVEYLAGPDNGYTKSAVLMKGISTNYFGKVKAGTPVAVLADGRIRPTFKDTAAGAGVAATTLNFTTAGVTGNLVVGDTLYFETQADTNTVASITDGDTVELSGAHTWDDLEVIRLNDGGTPVGFLDDTVSTYSHSDSDGVATHLDQSVKYRYRGAVVEANLTNMSPSIKSDLQGHFTFL